MSYRQLLTLSFLLNSLGLVLIKAVGELGLDDADPLIVLLMYSVGSFWAFLYAAIARGPFHRPSLLVGAAAGLGSVAGMVGSLRAAALAPGYVAFPLVYGGSMLLVALAGPVLFKEKIGPYGIAGIVIGAAAITLLSV